MIQISEVNLISVDKGEDSWAIEGEILFEEDLTTPFSVTYNPDYDELEDLEIEIIPGHYDAGIFKEMLLNATYQFEE